MRNAVINNFNHVELRTDVGALWENFLIAERKKRNEAVRQFPNHYFWRTWEKQEIDYVEEDSGVLHGFEIKWGKGKNRPPAIWKATYPRSSWEIVTRENYWEFVKES